MQGIGALLIEKTTAVGLSGRVIFVALDWFMTPVVRNWSAGDARCFIEINWRVVQVFAICVGGSSPLCQPEIPIGIVLLRDVLSISGWDADEGTGHDRTRSTGWNCMNDIAGRSFLHLEAVIGRVPPVSRCR